jgi:5-methylcytosine-specific restriction endonuclease McrA
MSAHTYVYICNRCLKQYSQKSAYNAHRKRKFQCEVRKDGKSNPIQFEFQCPHCGQHYNRKDRFDAHLKKCPKKPVNVKNNINIVPFATEHISCLSSTDQLLIIYHPSPLLGLLHMMNANDNKPEYKNVYFDTQNNGIVHEKDGPTPCITSDILNKMCTSKSQNLKDLINVLASVISNDTIKRIEYIINQLDSNDPRDTANIKKMMNEYFTTGKKSTYDNKGGIPDRSFNVLKKDLTFEKAVEILDKNKKDLIGGNIVVVNSRDINSDDKLNDIKKIILTRSKSRNRNIDGTMRANVWLTHIGRLFDAKCYTGCGKDISCFDFECGHIVAHSKGGPATLENLRPICTPCNRSMHTKDMNRFIKDHGFTVPRYTSKTSKYSSIRKKAITNYDNDDDIFTVSDNRNDDDIISVSSKPPIDLKKATSKKTIANRDDDNDDIVSVSGKLPTDPKKTTSKKTIVNRDDDDNDDIVSVPRKPPIDLKKTTSKKTVANRDDDNDDIVSVPRKPPIDLKKATSKKTIANRDDDKDDIVSVPKKLQTYHKKQ